MRIYSLLKYTWKFVCLPNYFRCSYQVLVFALFYVLINAVCFDNYNLSKLNFTLVKVFAAFCDVVMYCSWVHRAEGFSCIPHRPCMQQRDLHILLANKVHCKALSATQHSSLCSCVSRGFQDTVWDSAEIERCYDHKTPSKSIEITLEWAMKLPWKYWQSGCGIARLIPIVV